MAHPRDPCGPRELADLLVAARAEARRDGAEARFGDVSDAGVRRLLDLAYHAGIAQEEGRFPRFRLFSAPRTSPGRGHVSPRLLPPRPLTLPLLCKLAPAISLDRHALHVFEKDGEIFTDGVLSLTDLGLNRLAQALPGTAALDLQGAAGGLQVVVLDPGVLVAGEPMPTFELKDAGLSRLASVAALRLVDAWHRRAAEALLEGESAAVPGFARLLAGRWSDLLGLMVADRHGGMLVVLPDDSTAGVALPHPATDLRLGEVLRAFWQGSRSFWDGMSLTESAAPRLLRWNWDRERLFDGLHAVAALARMDGSVLFGPTLELKGFGARLPHPTADGGAAPVALADPATLEVLERVPLGDLGLGTRHAAAHGLCRERPGTLAFVVSQEGDLRVFAGHAGEVYLWKAHWQLFSS